MAWYMKLHMEVEEDFRDVGFWGVYKPPKASKKEKSMERFVLTDLLSIPIVSLGKSFSTARLFSSNYCPTMNVVDYKDTSYFSFGNVGSPKAFVDIIKGESHRSRSARRRLDLFLNAVENKDEYAPFHFRNFAFDEDDAELPVFPPETPETPATPVAVSRKRPCKIPTAPEKKEGGSGGEKKKKTEPVAATLKELLSVLLRLPDPQNLGKGKTVKNGNRKADSTDAGILVELVEKRRVTKIEQLNLLNQARQRLMRGEEWLKKADEDLEFSEQLFEGTKLFSDLLDRPGDSTKSGRKTDEGRAARHALSAIVALATSSIKDMAKAPWKAAKRLAKRLGMKKADIEGGAAAAVEMVTSGREFRQMTGVDHEGAHAAGKKKLVDAFENYQHDDKYFQIDTGLAPYHKNWKREVYFVTLPDDKKKLKWRKKGGVVLPGRSLQDKTIANITAEFKSSLYFKSCERGKVKWGDRDTVRCLCPSLRKPAKEVCVDEIKENTKHSVKFLRDLLLPIKEKGSSGTRRLTAIDEVLSLTESRHKFAAATMCAPITYAGMAFEGELEMNHKPCAFGKCSHCGVDSFFKQNLNPEHMKMSENEKATIHRFEKVTRSHGEVTELVTKEVTLGRALQYVKEDLKKYRRHVWKQAWTKRTTDLWRSKMEVGDAFGKVDFAAGLSFCSFQSTTCE